MTVERLIWDGCSTFLARTCLILDDVVTTDDPDWMCYFLDLSIRNDGDLQTIFNDLCNFVAGIKPKGD